VLEAPTATVLTYMRLKGKASHLAQTAVIPSFDIQPIVSVLANAAANVAEKIEVLKSFLADLFIGEFIQIVKRGTRADKCKHLLVQTAFRYIAPTHAREAAEQRNEDVPDVGVVRGSSAECAPVSGLRKK
jgi:tRNA G26 N,N-dimethylase Trm1